MIKVNFIRIKLYSKWKHSNYISICREQEEKQKLAENAEMVSVYCWDLRNLILKMMKISEDFS